MIDLAVSFLPWVVFTSVSHLTTFTGAVVLALVAAALVLALTKLRGRRIHLLDVASLGYFGLMLAVIGITQPTDLDTWSKYMQSGSYAALAVIVFGTIAIGRPFTISYAKETTPPELWDTDIFRQINTRISAAWGYAFVAGAVSTAVAANTDALPFVLHALIPYGALYLAFRYTQKASRAGDDDAAEAPAPTTAG